MPRKTDCTPETIEAICQNVRQGLSNKDAAALAGVSESAFYKWRRRGEAELARVAENNRRKVRKCEQPFVAFVQVLKKAVPERKQRLLDSIVQSAKGGRQWTETREVYRQVEGETVLVERVTSTKVEQPTWQAAAWLLERLHFDEFGKRQRVDVHTWEDEVIELIRSGRVTPEEVRQELGDELAKDLFKSAGISPITDGETEAESQ